MVFYEAESIQHHANPQQTYSATSLPRMRFRVRGLAGYGTSLMRDKLARDPVNQIGKDAELEACLYLQAKGLKLIQQNYYCPMGEIDLIMKDSTDIIFVEVRFRSRKNYGSAVETITNSKIKKLVKSATYFLQKKNWLHKINSRFDIIAINASGQKHEIDWIKNAFMVKKI